MDNATAQTGQHGKPRCRVDVLGPLRLRVDGAERPWPAGRPGRLLAALLLAAGRTVSVSSLVEAVWPEDPPDDPRAALHTTVRRARRALGSAGSRLVHRGHGYLLDRSGLQSDVDELVAVANRRDAGLAEIEEALTLWRGEPWDGFEDLAAGDASRLRECRRRLRAARARALADAARVPEAVAELVDVLADDPLAEGPVALLVDLLDRQGDVAGALAAYDDHRRLLADTLGLDPSPRLVELQQRVLRREQPPSANRPAATAPSRPQPPRTLFGREGQLQSVGRMLAAGRCVTLVGPGGVGKTSLAARVAQDRAGAVWWVDLTRAASGTDVLTAVAEAVDALVSDGGSLRAAVLERLARKPGLLVLDNCEHVASTAADLVEDLLRSSPRTTLLATSRERLDVDGEQVLLLPPLQLPARDDADDDALRASPAVALFLHRAEAVAPGVVGPDEVRVVADIVWRLDGLPLAIGLAAGRVGALTLADLRDRLHDQLDVLRTASRREHPRQRTLVATIAWSYDLLDEQEQEVFCGLSVFASAFDLDDVAAVLGRRAVPVVGDLVQRSLVSPAATAKDGTSRFVVLETLRAFGQGRLSGPTADRVGSAHGRWAADLARRIDQGLDCPDEAFWSDTASRRLPDLAAAYHRSLTSPDRAVARTITSRLQRWAYYRVRPDVLAWALPLIDGAEDAGVLTTAAAHAWMSDHGQEGLRLARRAVTEGRAAGDPEMAGRGAGILGDLLLGTGDLDGANAAYVESQHLGEAAHDRFDAVIALGGQLLATAWLGRPWQELAARAETARAGQVSPSVRTMLGYCLGEAWAASDPLRAVTLMTEAADEAEAVGSRLVVGVARTAATALAARIGAVDESTAALLATTLTSWVRTGNENLLLTSLRNTAPVLVRLGRHVAAAELLAALQQHDGSWGDEASALEAARSASLEALGDQAFTAAWAAGAGRTLPEAAEHARAVLGS